MRGCHDFVVMFGPGYGYPVTTSYDGVVVTWKDESGVFHKREYLRGEGFGTDGPSHQVYRSSLMQGNNETSWKEYQLKSWEGYLKWAGEQKKETSLKLQENWDRHKAKLAADDRDNWMHALIWLGVPGACIMAWKVWIPLFFG